METLATAGVTDYTTGRQHCCFRSNEARYALLIRMQRNLRCIVSELTQLCSDAESSRQTSHSQAAAAAATAQYLHSAAGPDCHQSSPCNLVHDITLGADRRLYGRQKRQMTCHFRGRFDGPRCILLYRIVLIDDSAILIYHICPSVCPMLVFN